MHGSARNAAVRVCYFVSEYPAVPHTFIRREIAELERNGCSVLRVSLRGNGRDLVDPADQEEKDRTRYIFDERPLGYVKALAVSLFGGPAGFCKAVAGMVQMMRRTSRPRVYHLAYLAEALVVAKWSQELGVGHIHAHFGTNNAEVAMLAHLLTGIPYSFTVHGPDEFDRPEYLGLDKKLKHAAFARVVSSFTGSQLRRWTDPGDWPKIKIVRCGLDAAFTSEPPRGMIASTTLVTIGRLSEQKGQLVLLDALAALARAGITVKTIIAGDGPLRPLLEHRIRQLGLSGQVELTGWLSNSQVRSLILSARAVVLPSFAEGLPVVLMEAMALSRPVITTYVAGIPELVTDKICGWLVPAGDVDALAAGIRECLDAPDPLISAMGRAGRIRTLERHDIARECRNLAALFSGEDVAREEVVDLKRLPALVAFAATGDQGGIPPSARPVDVDLFSYAGFAVDQKSNTRH
jgi:colanic acid/amylovoran biosynthesis glycosyltransferase